MLFSILSHGFPQINRLVFGLCSRKALIQISNAAVGVTYALMMRKKELVFLVMLILSVGSSVRAAENNIDSPEINGGDKNRTIWPLPKAGSKENQFLSKEKISTEPLNLLTERFSVKAGLFSGSIQSGGKVPSTAGQDAFSSERDFGLKQSQVFFPNVQLKFRFGSKQRLDLQYFQIDRTAGISETYPCYFDNVLFDQCAGQFSDGTDQKVGSSEFFWRAFNARLAVDLMQSDRYSISSLFSLQYDQAMFALQSYIPSGKPLAPYFRRAIWGAKSISPTVGLEIIYLIDSAKRWSVVLNTEKLKGGQRMHADLQYRWQPNISIGFGYTRLNGNIVGQMPIDLDQTVSGAETFFKFSY